VQLVGPVVVSEGEAGVEVLSEEFFWGFFNVLQEGSIYGLLSVQSLLGYFLLLNVKYESKL